ncbi:GDSL-type esterase/lipase family protein [Aquihabitans sp. McL0605]|uniref:GDSL-type esterase/lipase family protein n=1 Tax=Aquihabitans sp. McL0605 TaxID=3415671 RepID=UPI003CE83032
MWVLAVVLLVGGAVSIYVGLWSLRWERLAGGVAVGLLALAVAAIGVTHDPDRAPLDPNPGSATSMVAIGDSYMSGEGASAYFPGTDDEGSNKCHRSSDAFPYLAAQQLHASLTFAACSGARARDIVGTKDDGSKADGQYPDSPASILGGTPQIDALQGKHPTFVLVDVGGNDAGFGDLGKGCAIPTTPDCRRSASFWMKRLDTRAYPDILRTLQAVKAEAGGAPVFVVDYPNPLGPKDCWKIRIAAPELGFLATRSSLASTRW